MVLLLVFMQLTRDLFAIAKFLLSYAADKQTDKETDLNVLPTPTDRVVVGNYIISVLTTYQISLRRDAD